MKKEQFKEPVPCLICSDTGTELHELFFGNGVKEVSIKYHIQCFLCPTHHNHNEMDQYYCQRLCRILGINYWKLRTIVKNKATKQWNERERQFVIKEGEKVKEYYKDYM
jgi:hypothetical protein